MFCGVDHSKKKKQVTRTEIMTNKKLVFVFESVNIKSGAGSGEMEPKKISGVDGV